MNAPDLKIAKRERVSGLKVAKTPQTAELHDDRAERALIGAVLHKPELYTTLVTLVQPSDFCSVVHHLIWGACEQVYPHIDNLTIINALKPHYADSEGLDRYINSLIADVPSIDNAEQYAKRVRECGVLMRLFNAMEEMRGKLFDTSLSLEAKIDLCNALLFQASEQQAAELETSAQAMLMELWNSLDAKQGTAPGCPTGFKQMDAMLKRIYIGEVCLLVGHPGMGKTLMTLSVMRNNLNAGRRVVMFSLDNMPKSDIMSILVGIEADIPKVALLENSLTLEQHRRFVEAAPRVSEWKLDVIDEYDDMTPTQLRRRLRKMLRDHGHIDLVVIDGLWLMEADEPTDDRPRDMKKITTALMKIARVEFGLSILITHQYTQAAKDRGDKRPIINDVAESAAVQRNLPLILGMYRKSYYDRDTDDHTTQIYVMKDRKRGRQGESVSFLYDKGAYVEAETVTIDFGSEQ